MTRVRKIIIVLAVVFCLLLLLGWYFVSHATNSRNSVANSVATAVFQNSGITDKINSALYSNDTAIANQLGVSTETVDSAISNLNIDDWTVTSLPSDASSTGSYSYTYDGTDATVTTYDDPSYVTVNADGQNVTFEVPDSAKSYVTLLSSQG